MDWSYQLLAPDEQASLRALSVFPADFDLAAATAVIAPVFGGATAADVVFRLVDKSLVVVRRRAGAARYGLPETVRSYGAGRLAAAGELDAVRRRHREHFCQITTGWHESRFLTAAWRRRSTTHSAGRQWPRGM